MKGPNPFLLGAQAANRKAGGRAQRRAAEAKATKDAAREGAGLSVPALKKLIRRNKKSKGPKK